VQKLRGLSVVRPVRAIRFVQLAKPDPVVYCATAHDPRRIGAGLQRIMGGLNQVRAIASAKAGDFFRWLARLVISVDQVKLSDSARRLPIMCFGQQAVKR